MDFAGWKNMKKKYKHYLIGASIIAVIAIIILAIIFLTPKETNQPTSKVVDTSYVCKEGTNLDGKYCYTDFEERTIKVNITLDGGEREYFYKALEDEYGFSPRLFELNVKMQGNCSIAYAYMISVVSIKNKDGREIFNTFDFKGFDHDTNLRIESSGRLYEEYDGILEFLDMTNEKINTTLEITFKNRWKKPIYSMGEIKDIRYDYLYSLNCLKDKEFLSRAEMKA
jgi:hypothetical protein